MNATPQTFRAFRIHEDEQGYRAGIEEMAIGELSEGEVVVRTLACGICGSDIHATASDGMLRDGAVLGPADDHRPEPRAGRLGRDRGVRADRVPHR